VLVVENTEIKIYPAKEGFSIR